MICLVTYQGNAPLTNIFPVDSIEKLLQQDKFDVDPDAHAILLYRSERLVLDKEAYAGAWSQHSVFAIKILHEDAKELGQVILDYRKK